MTLERWAHWAEIIASFAVILTLIVVGGEVRDNTRALERQADLDRASALTTPFFEAPQLASILARIKDVDGSDPMAQALVDRYALSMEDAILWERHLWRVWLEHEADFNRTGATAELQAWVRGALESPDNRLYWEIKGPVSGPGFRALVDQLAQTLPR